MKDKIENGCWIFCAEFLHKKYSHVCGKKMDLAKEQIRLAGSLPRVWEKVNNSFYIIFSYRYTPTRVGKRLSTFT